MEQNNEHPPYPPKPEAPGPLADDNDHSPESLEYINRYSEWVAQTVLLNGKAALEEERLAKIAAEKAALDTVVFTLKRTFEEPSPSTFFDYSELLDRNARILNAGFEYYLDKAVESPKADQKIRLAMEMQSQLVRTIDAWRRLEKFLEDKRK